MSNELVAEIDKRAKMSRMSRSSYVRLAIEHWISKEHADAFEEAERGPHNHEHPKRVVDPNNPRHHIEVEL